MKLTADTITAVDIVELHLDDSPETRQLAHDAVHGRRNSRKRLAARARCAEILNARNGASL